MAKKRRPPTTARSSRAPRSSRTAVRKQSGPAKKAAPSRHRRKKSASRPTAARGTAPAALSKAEAIALLEWVHAFTTKMADGWPADRVAFQTAPTDNHLLWTLGHLATTYAWFTGLLTGSMGSGPAAALPASYTELFGYKSTPKPGAAAYPPVAEVKAHMNATYAQFLAALKATPEADLAKPCAMDTGGFASTRMDAVMKGVWHDGWHQGQLSSLRRALSLPPVM